MKTLSLTAIGRVAMWLTFTLLALTFLTWKLRQFRHGLAYSGRPFSWRAHYTCAIGVMSFCLGGGAILLTPDTMAYSSVMVICGSIAMAGVLLAIGHLAHVVTAFAASMPAIFMSLAGLSFHLKSAPIALLLQTLYLLCGAIFAGFLVFVLARTRHRQLVRGAIQAHPRHEIPDILARQKQMSNAYNPFSIRLEGRSLPVAGEAQQS